MCFQRVAHVAPGRFRFAQWRRAPQLSISLFCLIDDDAFELGFFIEEIGNVKKRVPIQTDIYKRRLHPGQHAHDAALVDIADDALVLFTTFDVELGNSFIFHDRDLLLATIHTNN